ncbi:phospholipid carrier-dependent glycosyltransferase [Conexibacter sp. W3-3-2]|uniref:ArnT family glycosyltransferase n=1 Tax=Conexibacter sp. W3-3-2 TaxID=2675227 RepID=UPI0012B73477|nr:glycosyltransferase family 39 protein [Conexibacter sp. W3-3-2]MTD43493.1 phospholipid carrier-dependent glycosyltransferase [Conexibacter sp. W3-3-2]
MSAVDHLTHRDRDRAPASPPPGVPPRRRGARDRARAELRDTVARARAWRPTRWSAAIVALLLGSFLVRIWGVDHGMPYAYNADENAHFLPKAIGLFGHGWNPHYFVNPPAYTYVLHIVFAGWFGGREAVASQFASDPTEVWVVARVTAAALGTLGIWLLYLAGKRFFDRRVGLLAAGLMAVAFLPVFYSHLALNDVPTLAPICLSLWGTAGILHRGWTRDYVVAGLGLGLACATKYTGGIVLLPLLAATVFQMLQAGTTEGALVHLRRVLLAGVMATIGFVAANPYAVLAFDEFRDGLEHQTTVSGDSFGKLGLTHDNGIEYYLWAFTWGLGWVPILAAAIAIGVLLAVDRRMAVVLAPAPLIFLYFMGGQERFFGRWLLPIFPIACILAAFVVIWAVDRLARRTGPTWKPALMSLGVVLLCGQGLLYSLHSGLVLSRDDTRNLTRAWMVENVAPRSKIVVEPIVPDAWAQDAESIMRQTTGNGNRWIKFPTSRSNIANDGSFIPDPGRIVNIEDYERTLAPELIDRYEEDQYCYVVSGSTQRGRAEAEPEQVPGAIAYYKELEKRSILVREDSPYREGADPVDFNFDWSFQYYPLAYHRPGPLIRVYRLTGGRCAFKGR